MSTLCEVCRYAPAESQGATLAVRAGFVVCIRCGDSIEHTRHDERHIVVGVARFYRCSVPTARYLARTIPAHRSLVLRLVSIHGMCWRDARTFAERYIA